MSEHSQELMDALQGLAAAGPREASPRVEQQLLKNFRTRAQRRRLAIWGSAAAVFAAVAATAATILLWNPVHVPLQPAAAVAQQIASDPETAGDDASASFYPLPDADALPPVEASMVVRVQMSGSSLRLLGYPVDVNLGAEPVQADVLLGQDGLARGVRLIQQ
jgi:hypothetical protein